MTRTENKTIDDDPNNPSKLSLTILKEGHLQFHFIEGKSLFIPSDFVKHYLVPALQDHFKIDPIMKTKEKSDCVNCNGTQFGCDCSTDCNICFETIEVRVSKLPTQAEKTIQDIRNVSIEYPNSVDWEIREQYIQQILRDTVKE